MSSVRRLSFLALPLLLAACGSAPPEHFYTLEPTAAIDAGSAAPRKVTISIGPVSVPERVDRAQIVLQQGSNQVKQIEDQRWAESLRVAIPRVLSVNLGRLLPGANVTASSDGTADGKAKYKIAVDILRFDSRLGDAIVLEARWRIQAVGATPQIGATLLREGVRGAGYEDIAAAHGRALAGLSQQLAAAIVALDAAR